MPVGDADDDHPAADPRRVRRHCREQRHALEARAGRVALDRQEMVERGRPVESELLGSPPELEIAGEVRVLLSGVDAEAQPVGHVGQPRDRLRRQPVERVDGQLEVLLLRVLEPRVREAAEALDEEHHRRDPGARYLRRIVQGPRREPVRRVRDLEDRLVAELDQLGVEEDRLDRPDLVEGDVDRLLLGEALRARLRVGEHRARARAASRWRWSSSCSAVSTTDVTMPGLQTTPPDVHTAPPPARAAMWRSSSASFAAPARASRR